MTHWALEGRLVTLNAACPARQVRCYCLTFCCRGKRDTILASDLGCGAWGSSQEKRRHLLTGCFRTIEPSHGRAYNGTGTKAVDRKSCVFCVLRLASRNLDCASSPGTSGKPKEILDLFLRKRAKDPSQATAVQSRLHWMVLTDDVPLWRGWADRKGALHCTDECGDTLLACARHAQTLMLERCELTEPSKRQFFAACSRGGGQPLTA